MARLPGAEMMLRITVGVVVVVAVMDLHARV